MRSAAIDFVDRDAVLAEARELARRLRAAHPEVLRVILFGSFARGRGGPRSDLDMVLVVEQTCLSPRDRIAHYLPTSARPVDLLVYTRTEVEQMSTAPPPVLREALAHGLEL